MQLVAYGAQDVFLTGNPQITFFKVVYRRHTNFAVESIQQVFNGDADFGRRVTCTISRNGDLAYRTYLQVTLPEINQSVAAGSVYARWLDNPGEQLISQVEVEIGGQRIDRQYGDWMHIWNQLTLSKEQQSGYHKMVGNTTQLTYITDPGFANVSGPCAAAGGLALRHGRQFGLVFGVKLVKLSLELCGPFSQICRFFLSLVWLESFSQGLSFAPLQ